MGRYNFIFNLYTKKKNFRVSMASFIVSKSELLPMITATFIKHNIIIFNKINLAIKIIFI